ncbi:uncharacterized protein [Typha latifolia]|uniref:uncharacterized protein n=1 Tax=Typha latifolia TaxID=4733 RepID=UPI003C2BF7B5
MAKDDKKRKKKKKEKEKEEGVVHGEGQTGVQLAVEEDTKKDKKRKEEEEPGRGDTDVRVKDAKKEKKRKKREKYGRDGEGQAVEKDVKKEKKRKKREECGGKEDAGAGVNGGGKDKGQTKEKREKVEYIVKKDPGEVEEKGDEGFDDKKKEKKRRIADDSVRFENDKSIPRKKAKKTTVVEDKEIVDDGAEVLPAAELSSGKKRKKRKEQKDGDLDTVRLASEGFAKNIKEKDSGASKGKEKETSNMEKDEKSLKPSRSKKGNRVSFSSKVEVFNPGSDSEHEEDGGTQLVQGKRFSKEEDNKIMDAIQNYIETNQLGEEGTEMILNCVKHPQVKNCWKEIGACLPKRPYRAVYHRAHVLLQRSEKRKWEPEEYDAIRKFHKQHGANWKKLADQLGKHRIHVKDTWRRIKPPNLKKGSWSQEEYQALFDLVNMDLRLKAFEEKKSKHGMLRDNIAWEAISEKLSTRAQSACCVKWYDRLSSSLVNEGLWADKDDYHLLEALQNIDASCVEDVDWDNLLEHRSGETCRKRWNQMIRHIGGNKERPFIEQVEVLSNRYCPEMLEYRK